MLIGKYQTQKGEIEIHSVDKSHWSDFEKLFGDNGACGGCWCMAWRLYKKDFDINQGNGNKMLMKSLFEDNAINGLIAYNGQEPIAWCSVAPREEFVRLEKSRVFGRIDDMPVWSISCMFIRKDFRMSGISTILADAACRFSKAKGASMIESYPITPYSRKDPDAFLWTGTISSYEKAGFYMAAKRSEWKCVMRRELG